MTSKIDEPQNGAAIIPSPPRQQQFFTEQEHQRRVEEFGSKLLKSMHHALQKHSVALARLQMTAMNAALEKMLLPPSPIENKTKQDEENNNNHQDEIDNNNNNNSPLPSIQQGKFYGEVRTEEEENENVISQKKKIDPFSVSTLYPVLHQKQPTLRKQTSDLSGNNEKINKDSSSNGGDSPKNNQGKSSLGGKKVSNNNFPKTFAEKKIQNQLEVLVSSSPSYEYSLITHSNNNQTGTGGTTKRKINPMASFTEKQMQRELEEQAQHQQLNHLPREESNKNENNNNNNGINPILANMNHVNTNKALNFLELPSAKNLQELRILAYALREATTKLSCCVNRDKQSSLIHSRVASGKSSLQQQATIVDDMLLVSSARNILSHLEGNILGFVQKRRRARLLATTMPQNLLDQLSDLMKRTGIVKQQVGDQHQQSASTNEAEIQSYKNALSTRRSSTVANSALMTKVMDEKNNNNTSHHRDHDSEENKNSSLRDHSKSSEKTEERRNKTSFSSFVAGAENKERENVDANDDDKSIVTNVPALEVVDPFQSIKLGTVGKSALKKSQFFSGGDREQQNSGKLSMGSQNHPSMERKKSRVGFDDNIQVFQVDNNNQNKYAKAESSEQGKNDNDDNDDDEFSSDDVNRQNMIKQIFSEFQGLKEDNDNNDLVQFDPLRENSDSIEDGNNTDNKDFPFVLSTQNHEYQFKHRRRTLRSSENEDGVTNTNDADSSNRRVSFNEILSAARSQLEASQIVVGDKQEREERERTEQAEAEAAKKKQIADAERAKFQELENQYRNQVIKDGDPMFIDIIAPRQTPVDLFEESASASKNKKQEASPSASSNSKQNESSPRRRSTIAGSNEMEASANKGRKGTSTFGSEEDALSSTSMNKKKKSVVSMMEESNETDAGTSSMKNSKRRMSASTKLHEVRMNAERSDDDNDGKSSEHSSQENFGPQLLSDEEEALIRAMGTSVWDEQSRGGSRSSLKRKPSALNFYGSQERDQDLGTINKTGATLATLLDTTKEELASYALHPKDAQLLRQLVTESENLLGEMEPISQLLSEEQKRRRQFVQAVRSFAMDEYNDITANLLHKQHAAIRLKEQKRTLIKQYLIWRQTKRADAAMTSTTFEDHISRGLSKRSVGTQCSVPASAIPIQLVKTVRMMQEIPNLQRHVNEVRKLVVELSSVDAKSGEAMRCKVCSGSLHDAILIWPCGDTVCKKCAREAVREYADQPFKMCPACRMISMTEDFNVSPNLVVSGIAAKWSFKQSGFYDVASASDALQKRLLCYQREEVMRAYEAVQEATNVEQEDDLLGDSEIITKIDP